MRKRSMTRLGALVAAGAMALAGLVVAATPAHAAASGRLQGPFRAYLGSTASDLRWYAFTSNHVEGAVLRTVDSSIKEATQAHTGGDIYTFPAAGTTGVISPADAPDLCLTGATTGSTLQKCDSTNWRQQFLVEGGDQYNQGRISSNGSYYNVNPSVSWNLVLVSQQRDNWNDRLIVEDLVPVSPDVTITSPSAGSTLSSSKPVFSGHGEAGSTVTVKDDAGNTLCTATVQGDGTWTCTSTKALGDGSHQVTATQADADGIPSEATVGFSVEHPDVTVTSPAAGSTVATDKPTFVGTGDPGATVTVKDGYGNTVCSATVAPDGSWLCTATTAQAEGEHTYMVSQDSDGSSTSIGFTVDLPNAAVTAVSITSPNGDVETKTPVFSGNGEPGATVTVTSSTGSTLCTAQVALDGTWSCTSQVELALGGNTVTVSQDMDGSSASATFTVVEVVDIPVAHPAIAGGALLMLAAAWLARRRRNAGSLV